MLKQTTNIVKDISVNCVAVSEANNKNYIIMYIISRKISKMPTWISALDHLLVVTALDKVSEKGYRSPVV